MSDRSATAAETAQRTLWRAMRPGSTSADRDALHPAGRAIAEFMGTADGKAFLERHQERLTPDLVSDISDAITHGIGIDISPSRARFCGPSMEARPMPDSGSQPTAPAITLADAFEMGFVWGRSLHGQTMEDSRAVGRTLLSDTFEAIEPAIQREIKLQGFDSFKDADNGIYQAKRIIKAALS